MKRIVVEEEEQPVIEETTVRPTAEAEEEREVATPLSSETAEPQSSSSRKLERSRNEYPLEQDTNELDCFVLFSLSILQTIFGIIACPECKQNGVLLEEVSAKKQGLSVAFILKCSSCLWEHEFFSSQYASIPGKNKKNSMEINIRSVLALRNLGIGYDGLDNFCTQMNMPKPMTKSNYQKIINSLHENYMKVAESSMKHAAEELKLKEKSTDISASFDGSWQKPGYSSLNGIVSAISISTGKVLDFEVKSKKCKECEVYNKMDRDSEKYLSWKADHALECSTNHIGSSGSMEVTGVKSMYERSVDKTGLRYTNFIGDGDSSTFLTVSQAKPYGEDVTITKKECVGHVQKRLGSRLRKLKVSYNKRKLSDGKAIGGLNRLTDKMVDIMQNYYGLAIRQNKGNLDGMINDVKAGLYHLASSAEKPQHHLCPEGSESWCGWQRDKANKTSIFKSKKGLPAAIVEVVEPIYNALAEPVLLSRCLDSFTQNPNESLNNLIWKRCPKKIYQGKKVVELCTASAVAAFNDGASSIASLLKSMGIKPGKKTMAGIRKIDQRRIHVANLASSDKKKKRRKKIRAIKKGLWDFNKEKEGTVYESGAF